MAKISAHVYIEGRVQGVFFRQNTKRKAISIGVKGWIRNLDDGRVEAVFEGEEAAVKSLVDFSGKGPIGASVTKITVDWEPFQDKFGSFEVV